MSEMVEKVARAIYAASPFRETAGEYDDQSEIYRRMCRLFARAAIEAFNDPSMAFIHALSERMHDARFSKSGEDYPVARNFIRSFVDAALSGEGR